MDGKQNNISIKKLIISGWIVIVNWWFFSLNFEKKLIANYTEKIPQISDKFPMK